MAIQYFDSLLNQYYGREELNRQTVLDARRELRSVLGAEPVSITLSSQMSILTDALANAEAIATKEGESFEDYYDSNVSTVSSTRAAYVASPTSITEAAYRSAVNSFMTGFSGQFSETAQRLSVQATSVQSSTGISSSEWSFRVAEDIGELAAATVTITFESGTDLILGTFSALSGFGNINNYLSAGAYIINVGEGGLLDDAFTLIVDLFTKPLELISSAVSSVYNTIFVGSGFSDRVVEFYETRIDPDTYISGSVLSNVANSTRESIIQNGLAGTAAQIAIGAVGGLINGVGNILSPVLQEVRGWDWVQQAESAVTGVANSALSFISQFISSREVSVTLEAVGNLLGTIFPSFVDGVSETRFGTRMERSWIGSGNSFLNNLTSVNFNLVGTTPLDPSEGQNASLYGNMMLGTPFTYTRITDPNNRAMINTFVKDSTFLSLTPGLPKYNGGAFQQEISQQVRSLFTREASTYLNQTPTAQEMADYLLKNGMDLQFAEKDKRYYTFQPDYEQYFAYLETMLNTLWVKMGLGTAEDGSQNIFTFFNPSSNSSDYDSSLRDRYRSSIGFFVNPEGAVTEGIGNQTVSSDLASGANARADEFQRINYITGMGTGGNARNIMRQVGVGITQFDTLKDIVRANFNTGNQPLLSFGGVANLAASVIKFSNTQDMSALVQQFQVTNGMKVTYPDLWTSSNYSKFMNFSFNFVSPYGDPLSIFQYVYVPFFSLLSFAMPRQAAENGLVTPFLVRADMPGIVTSDLAMITQVDWVKGGPQGLFTKDKLPRAISGTFTVQDLYPYLAATKRLSFLSANPSYTVFLDNMAGLRAVYSEVDDDPYSEYWKKLVNRVNGSATNQGLWNRFSTEKQAENSKFATTYQRPSLTRTISKKAAPWLSKI